MGGPQLWVGGRVVHAIGVNAVQTMIVVGVFIEEMYLCLVYELV